jgi:hypothetical protein
VQAAHGLQRNALVARHNDELGFVKGLERERRQLYAKGRLGRDDERRLKEIGELFESTRSWREPLEASFARLDQRLAAGRDAIAATKLAVFEWAAAHRALAAAVREGRTVRVDALLQATLEARELVRRLRAL